jgi:hypothetical protein
MLNCATDKSITNGVEELSVLVSTFSALLLQDKRLMLNAIRNICFMIFKFFGGGINGIFIVFIGL